MGSGVKATERTGGEGGWGVVEHFKTNVFTVHCGLR